MSLIDDIRTRHPGFRQAVFADLRMNSLHRGERFEFRSKFDATVQALRLCLVSDAFLGQVLYRAKAAMQRRGIPLLPRICHRLAMASCQISIGDPVIMQPGIYVVHGQVVLDGIVEVGSGAVIAPWVTVGLRSGNVQGPTIGENVQIGTGAKIIGPVTVGEGASVGANAVVVSDIPAGDTFVGVPAQSKVK